MRNKTLVWTTSTIINDPARYYKATGSTGMMYTVKISKSGKPNELKIEYGNACPMHRNSLDLHHLYQCAQFFDDTLFSIKVTGEGLKSMLT